MAYAVSTSESSPWIHLMQDTLLYCFEAVDGGNKSSTRGAERFYNERRLRRGIPQEQVATRQQARHALHACINEGGLFHRYKPGLYQDIRRCNGSLTSDEANRSQQDDLVTVSLADLRRRNQRSGVKSTPA
eukprot:COSAG05_NODE_2183_length_3430_cov_84.123386_4_plen_131_part_00